MQRFHPSQPPRSRCGGGGTDKVGTLSVLLFSRSPSKSWLHIWGVKKNIFDCHISLLFTTSQQVWGCSVSACHSQHSHTRTCTHWRREMTFELCAAFQHFPNSAWKPYLEVMKGFGMTFRVYLNYWIGCCMIAYIVEQSTQTDCHA